MATVETAAITQLTPWREAAEEEQALPTPDGGFAESFEREALPHMRSLYGGAYRLTRNAADAEDLVQETFLRAFRAFHLYTPGTNIRAWLFTILRRVHQDGLRRLRRGPGFDVVEEDTASLPPAQEIVARGGLDLARALEALSEPFRTAVVLRDLEELAYQDIARITEAPIGTVMSRIHRGRKALRERLKKE